MDSKTCVDTNNLKNNENRTVSSVGNSWIICRSKTHPGRVYYFNTLTGEAAWNLSDAEIAKAKNTTKNLPNQQLIQFQECPEPKEPPMDETRHEPNCNLGNKNTSSRIYNKQIINNQFPKHAYGFAPFMNAQCVCTSVTPIALNNPGPPLYNSAVWSVPPPHQFFIAPTVSPVVNQAQTLNLDLQQNVPVQNTSLPLSRRFVNINRGSFHNRNIGFNQGIKKFGHNNYGQGQKSFMLNRRAQNRTGNDLRQIIAEKRRQVTQEVKDVEETKNVVTSQNVIQSEPGTSSEVTKIKNTIKEELFPSDIDDEWIEENKYEEGSKNKIDVSVLTTLANATVKCDCWYIVTDTNVMLNHFKFLSILVESDEQCRLIVPHHVVTELRKMTRDGSKQHMIRARRAIRFISQKLSAGITSIGEGPPEAGHRALSYAFNCCLNLAEKDYHVILISNDNDLKSYKNTSIPVYTIQELKDLLTYDKIDQSIPSMSASFLQEIKITVPNEISTKMVTQEVQTNNKDTENVKVNEVQDNNAKISSAAPCPEKRTMDAGVQTDFMPFQFTEENRQITNDSRSNSLSASTDQICQTSYEFGKGIEEPSTKREISLKRSVSDNTITNSEKRQFKWRRRKPANKPETIVSDSRSLGFDRQESCTNSSIAQSNSSINQMDEYIENSETSSMIYKPQKSLEKTIIEETSTSDIISNTPSYVGSESNCITVQPLLEAPKIVEETETKHVMFEITSLAMNESLVMKCEEWVSRFVQIMEEVLSEILQLGPPFPPNLMPPPWTIHEATECIKRKFRKEADVADAATKLSTHLFKISDGRGKINANISPTDYMEMYSYGVYLVDSLQVVLSNCEDLHTAEESLTKLLNDIQDTNNIQNDSFMEYSSEPSVILTQNSSPAIPKEPIAIATVEMDNTKPKTPEQKAVSPQKYNLRSNKKPPVPDKEEQKSVKFIRKIDIEQDFFTCLNLQKKEREKNAVISQQNTSGSVTPQIVSVNQQESPKEKINLNNDKDKINNTVNEPKIIRNFTKCLEFEKKLQTKYVRETLDLDLLDYSLNPNDDYEDYDDGYMDDEYEYYDDDENAAENEYIENENDVNETDCNGAESATHIDEKDNFKYFINKIQSEVQETFLQLRTFCEETHIELRNSQQLQSGKKKIIKEKAEEALLHIDLIYKSLNSIFDRETHDPNNNLQALLRKSGVTNWLPDENQSASYRNVISKYISQANILQESIKLIISVVKE